MSSARVVTIARGVLIAVNFAAGGVKLIRSREQLVASGQGWATDFPAAAVKAIGVVEVLGGGALALPTATSRAAAALNVAAAAGVALLHGGATITHLRRAEAPTVPVNLTLLIAAVVVGRDTIRSFPSTPS